MLYFNRTSVFLILVQCFLNVSNCSKILLISSSSAPSHQKVYNQLATEVAQRGYHEVHLVSPIRPENVTQSKNLIVYDVSELKDMSKLATQRVWDIFFKSKHFLNFFQRHSSLHQVFHRSFEVLLESPEVERLLKTQKKFDVCIVEWFYPTLAVFGHIFQCPLIGISSNGMLLTGLDAVGNPSHPVLAPDQDLPLSQEMNFFERVWSGIWAVYARIFYQLVTVPEEEKTIRKYFGDNMPPLRDMVANISLLLVNTNMIFHRIVPNLPTVVQFGGRKKTELSLKPLNKELEQYINNSQNGVVYFSLGSGVQPETFKPNIIKTFQDTFTSLPFNFIWKWNGLMDNKPANVMIIPWLDQESLLAHPNVKLFIYQGGLQSSEETISAHKPIIGIPFHSDQTSNIETCVRHGMGETIALEDLTVERLRNLILKVVNNPSYVKNAEKLDLLIRDQPLDGLDKAVWWIEYVIRHKGAHHLRSAAATMPFWKYLMLDVIAFGLAVLFLSYKIVKVFSTKIIKFLLFTKEKPKVD